MTQRMAERWLVTDVVAAEMLGIGLQTLRNDRAKAGLRRFPYVRIGRAIRYDIHDLRQIVEQNRISGSMVADAGEV